MAAIYELVPSGWTIDRSTKVIAYIGHDHAGTFPSYATVIQFHRWLQSLADDPYAIPASSDELDITNVDPSQRSTDNIITLINGYTIGDTESEHLYDGSIVFNGGADIYDGIVNFGNADVQIQILQDGGVIADDWWNYNGGGLNPSELAGISHRFMIKTRTSSTDIDGRRLIGIARRYGYTYSEFRINGTARGNNVLALTDALDLNNETPYYTISGYTDITNLNVGYNGIDVDNNGTVEYYYSQWQKSGHSINDFFEYMKYITRDGESATLYGIPGEGFRGITHQIAISGPSGTYVEPELITWAGATPGTGQLLAIDSVTAGTIMWIQLLTGQAPTGAVALSGAGGGSSTQGTVTDRVSTLSFPFVGASTGSAIIGAYGLGIKALDLTSSDKVTDLYANVIEPPNYVTNTVGSLVGTEDYVMVAPYSGATDTNGDPAIWKNQMLLQSGLTTDDITNVVVAELIPSDTPSSGTIRVTDDDGYERRLEYSGWTDYTFDVTSTDGQEDFAAVNATPGAYTYITYIDQLATGGDPTTVTFQGVQTGSRDLVVIVRDGGGSPIKQFISAWSYTSSNQTINAIRTTDV